MSVDVRRDGSVAILTIDRPTVLNALDLRAITAVRDHLLELKCAGDIRCIIVTGAGDRAFIGGADIKFMASVNEAEAARFASCGHEVGRLLETMPQPTIAAINGFALGGGCEIALACDIRYAARSATFGQPEVKYGLLPGWGGTQRLARITTLGFAKELIFTGRIVGADEALARGLVEAIYDPVLTKALETAHLIAANGPAAIAAAKQLLDRSLQGSHRDNLAAEERQLAAVLVSDDAREGLVAFMEKRQPRFRSS